MLLFATNFKKKKQDKISIFFFHFSNLVFVQMLKIIIHFYRRSERLDKENTLDLHFYHLDEAIAAVNTAVAMKEEGE